MELPDARDHIAGIADVPDASRDVTRLADAIWPHAVRAAATLRLADHLADGAKDVKDLAARMGLDPDALGRLLAYLVSHGVFHRAAPGVYDLNPAARLLLDDHPARLRARLDQDGLAGRLDRAAAFLADAVRTGEPVYESAYGRPYYEDIADDPRLLAEFDGFAHWYTGRSVADVIEGYQWGRVGTVVDVGGGSGMLLTRLLQAYPRLRGVLIDLPSSAAKAEAAFDAAGLSGRCEAIGGSFFDPLPRGGDVYLLSGVLIDWDDQSATTILRRCAEAGGAHGRVLVAEQWEVDEAAFTDEDLRILVLVGGRVRTPEHLGTLAARAGLTVLTTRLNPRGVRLVELGPAPAA
ncbi:methyltransferase [Sphaerisporangium sp. NPDC088356]|uniref:methyltransferase n=1 Tax=Sphaerisporangium sp. NPDC088356 TaxID=3154871 RepID=UPI00342EAE8A